MNKGIINIKFLGILLIVLILVLVFLYTQNNWISKTRLRVNLSKLPKSFNEFKIIHISDLHNKSFGENQQYLINKISESHPDIIVITGDLVDSRRYNENIAMKFIDQAIKIAPVYYVTGNHELRSGKFQGLEKKLVTSGVKILRNSWEELEINGESIFIVGVDDPYTGVKFREQIVIREYLEMATTGLEEDSFKVLLSHRPEKINIYAEYGFDLVFSGHAHGGQFRFPFLGGLIVPNQGFFPKYTAGIHELDNTMMIISRGLGNSIVPQRILNRPEIIETKLLIKE